MSLTQLFSYSFAVPDVNPIDPAFWTTQSGFSDMQVVGHACQSTSNFPSGGVNYTALAAPNNQYIQAALASLQVGTFSLLTLTLRGDDTGNNGYQLSVQDNGDGTVSFSINSVTAAVPTNLFFNGALPFSSTDTFLFLANGTTLSGYQNGNLVGTATDSTYASGKWGFQLAPNFSLAFVSVSSVAGGTISSPLPSAYSVPDCRVPPAGPNASRTVQGTKIYDVQTSSNSAIPPVDSRAAGAPVDCRVSPNIPQNSRAPGTFGPGE